MFAQYDNYGNFGYINTPSAYNFKEGYYSFHISRNKPERRYTLSASPFSWMDASIFYVDITRKAYGGSYKQSYKDKGFNVKISPFSIFGHRVGIGMNDLAGTGLFSSEYVVLSNNYSDFEYSIGIGWGTFNNGAHIPNPLTKMSDNFEIRPSSIKDRGGNFDLDKYFSGRASLFFGINYKLRNNLNFSFELDPTDISNQRIPYSKPTTRYSFGINHFFKNFNFKYSLQRGKNLGIQISYAYDALDFNSKIHKNLNTQADSFNALQKILGDSEIGLKSISKNNKALIASVRQISYPDHQLSDNYVTIKSAEIARLNGLNEIVVKQFYQGMEVANSTYDVDYGYKVKNKKSESSELIYDVRDQFPYISSQIYPSIRNFIAGREQFYFGGVFLENDTAVVLKENIIFISNLKYSLWDNFSGLIYPPVDTYPEQVRSDNKEYFKKFNKQISLGRFEVNYFLSPKRNHYLRFSSGIYEEMFGGLGLDYVYSPEGSLFSWGFESYYVRKRDYNMRFQFKKYSNFISRVSAQIKDPLTKIRLKISYGEYLAGDIGYTLELKRSFKNGVEYGVFFSRTDVPKNLYGEGSFDKGIKIRIPIQSFFNRNKTLSKYEWRPLTKDPAALLIKSIDLMDEVDRYRFY